MKRLFIFALLLLPVRAWATHYYVDKTDVANCTNAVYPTGGTIGNPWCTIAAAGTGGNGRVNSTVFAPDDIITIKAGTYDERVTPTATANGTVNHPITFDAGTVSRPILRGFTLGNHDYFTISGFIMTNSGLTAEPSVASVYFNNSTSDAVGNIVVGNYFHDTTTVAVRCIPTNTFYCDGLIIRNNITFGIGTPFDPVTVTGGRAVAFQCRCNNSLIEGNTMSYGEDFVNIYGQRNVVRNNAFGESDEKQTGCLTLSPDMTACIGWKHIDAVQGLCSGGSASVSPSYLLVENNTYQNNTTNYQPNTHFHLNNSSSVCGGSTTSIIRRNVINNLGARSFSVSTSSSLKNSLLHQKFYNNTVVNAGYGGGSIGTTAEAYNTPGGPGTTEDAKILNNIFVDAIKTGYTSGITLSGCTGTCTADYNLGYQTTGSISWSAYMSTQAHATMPVNLLNRNPVFVSATNFSLDPLSPAIDHGGCLTTASAAGTTSQALTVADAHMFQDGWGGGSANGVAADFIDIAGTTVQVSTIDYTNNVITLASAKSWSNAACISLYKDSSGNTVLVGSAMDLGAFEYGGNPAITVDGISPAFGAQNATAAVTITGGGFSSGHGTVTTSCGTDITVSAIVVVSDNSITANFAVVNGATIQTCLVYVTTDAGTSNPVNFDVIAGNAPTISSILPASGYIGTTISFILAGTKFDGGNASVVFGTGVTVSNVVVVSAIKITGTAAIASTVNTTTLNVTVTTDGGVSNPASFQPLSTLAGNAGRLRAR